jgi:aminoglycoside phosphotransferase (APT) family kinase protein
MSPPAEVVIDDALLERLLREQHPDLADLPRTFVGEGWDNVMVRLGDHLVARLPRRLQSVGSISVELQWLPVLAPRLPLPVPEPVREGVPGSGYPWPWSVTRWYEGASAAVAPPSDLVAAGTALGAFLAALHRPAPAHAPENPWRGVPLAERAETTARHFGSDELRRLAGPDIHAVYDVWEAGLNASPWDGPDVWVHGDLHGGNILTADGEVSAIIDFGDLTSGDPAVDLMVGWIVLDRDGRGALRAAYPVDEATWLRGRAWALAIGAAVLAGTDESLTGRMGARAIREAAGLANDGLA